MDSDGVLVVRRVRIWLYPLVVLLFVGLAFLLTAAAQVSVKCTRAAGECVVTAESLLGTEVKHLPLAKIHAFAVARSYSRGAGKYTPSHVDSSLVIETSDELVQYADLSIELLDPSIDDKEVAALDAFLHSRSRESASLRYGGFASILALAFVLSAVYGTALVLTMIAKVRISCTDRTLMFDGDWAEAGGESQTTHPLARYQDVIVDPKWPRRLRICYTDGESAPTPNFHGSRQRLERIAAQVRKLVEDTRP